MMQFLKLFSLSASALLALFMMEMNSSYAAMPGAMCQLGDVCDIQPGPFAPESIYLLQGGQDQQNEVVFVCHLESASNNFSVSIYSGDDLVLDKIEGARPVPPHHFVVDVNKEANISISGHFNKTDQRPQGTLKFMSALDARGQVSCSLSGAQSVVNTVS